MKTAEQNKKIIFTIVALNYLPYGIKVRESFLKYNAGWKFVIYVVDKVPSRDIWQRLDKLRKSGIDIRFIDEIDDYFAADDFKAKYILYEFATAVKPFVFKSFFDAGAEKVIYIDPDIVFYNSIKLLEDELDRSDIILTPHIRYANRATDDSEMSVSVEQLQVAGIYNLGFAALKNTPNSVSLLDYWGKTLADKGYFAPNKGFFCDQKWADMFPVFFEKCHILKDDGYNVAQWNLHEITLSKRNETYFANNSKLVFYHFSGWKGNLLQDMEDYFRRARVRKITSVLCEILQNYQPSKIIKDFQNFSQIKPFYDHCPLPYKVSRRETTFYLRRKEIRRKIADKAFSENVRLSEVYRCFWQQLPLRKRLSKKIKLFLDVRGSHKKKKPYGISWFVEPKLFHDEALLNHIRNILKREGVAFTLVELMPKDLPKCAAAVYACPLILSDALPASAGSGKVKVVHSDVVRNFESFGDILPLCVE